MFDIDIQSRIPIYEQIYNKVIELIIKGILVENAQLPSVRNLSKELNVNPNTVAKAYQELERSKIIYSLSGRGSFVSEIDREKMKERILEDFDICVRETLQFGLTKDELKNRIDGVSL
ncbi:MAG: GntR family transcriptional regulator [Clostridiales bacterium]|jgi:GntR family transcriptional regulator|nr:GntR family transcriptional regulator [Clostridiales bacterium]